MLTLITPNRKMTCPRLFRRFSVSGIQKAELKITGLGLFRAFLNGKRIGNDYLTPGYNDYDAYLTVSSYDVTDLLEQGENLLEVVLGDGWYKGRFGLQGTVNIWGEDYILGAKLIADGKTVLETDESWQASESVIRSSSIYDGETRDDTVCCDTVCTCSRIEKQYHLEEQHYPRITVYEKRTPKLIITPKGESVLDFGQNAAGIVRFVNRYPKEAVIHLTAGEVLQNGCFYRDNLRSAKAEYIYISDGVEKEVEPWFTFYGFRYMLVQGAEQIDPNAFTALYLSSEMRNTLRCETANPLINRLIQNSLWSQRSNFVGVPTDCPQRDERLGWTGDAQVFAATAMYQTACGNFYRQFARSLREDQVRYLNGNLPMYSPSLKGQGTAGGFVWADAGVIIPMTAWRFFGDRDALEEAWPLIRDYVEVLIADDVRLGGTHVQFDRFCFGDWLALDGENESSVRGGTSERFIQGAYYLKVIRLAAEAAHTLQKTEAERYDRLAEDIHKALLDEYVTPNGHLSIDTQTGYALALTEGIFRKQEVTASDLHIRLQRDSFRLKTGFTGTPILLSALIDSGYEKDAFRILLNEEYPGWLYCVKLGATTTWERWNSILPDGRISGTGMNSLNHYAYGSVCETIYSRIAGLRPAAPGWKKALIAPHIDARLHRISLEYDSPAGIYSVCWEVLSDGSCLLTATVPDGAEAEVILPYHPENLRESLSSCTKTYTWQPVKNLLHIYNLETPVSEIMAHPDGKILLEEFFPNLVGALEQSETDVLKHTLFELIHQPPYLDYQKVLSVESKLKELSVCKVW